MNYLHSEYGYISEIGQFLIPKIMQQESRFKASKDNTVTLVKFEADECFIVLNYHSTVAKEEIRKLRKAKPKEIRVIDVLGRVVLPKHHRERLKISPHDALVCYLVNDGSIRIRMLENKQSDTSKTE